jgi:hypothetical protein
MGTNYGAVQLIMADQLYSFDGGAGFLQSEAIQ